MTDPVRLLDDSTADPNLRELVGSLSPPVEPSARAESALMSSLASSQAALPAAATGSLVAKGIVSLLVAGTLVGGWALTNGGDPAASPAAHPFPPSVAAQVTTESGPEAAERPQDDSSGKETPAEADEEPVLEQKSPAPKTKSPAPLSPLAKLRLEESLLESARAARASRPQEALATLLRHEREFPRGQLVAERLYMKSQIQARLGNEAGARATEARLLKSFPRSSYARQLRERSGQSSSEK